MIIATNGAVLIAVGLCMINNPIVILVGRFFYGMASGAFSVFCPKYVAEMAPIEYRGPFGTLNQFMCTVGIVVIACMGIPIPSDPVGDHTDKDSFMVQNYWRVCWGLPVIFSLIQVLLMVTVFKYETPISLKENNKEVELTQLFNKLFQQN